MEIADLYEIVLPLQLDGQVPHDIREQFDKARNAAVQEYDTVVPRWHYAEIGPRVLQQLFNQSCGSRAEFFIFAPIGRPGTAVDAGADGHMF